MDRNREQIEYYKNRAAEYEQIYYRDIPERRAEIDNEARRLKKLVKNRNVLDIACGTGYWTEIMSQTASGIIACDISEEMILEAKKKKLICPVNFVIADLNKLPFKNNSFDFISLGFWFSHHPRQHYPVFFNNLKAVAGQNAHVWLIDNNPPAEGPNISSIGQDEFNNNYKKRYLNNGEEFVILKNYFSKDELIELFSSEFKLRTILFNKYYWSVDFTID